MDIERPRRTNSTPTTSELFICFTSRLSHSSKSMLSPGHSGDKSASLSASLSRRLRYNGSLRGGAQSPAMFPSKKNRGGSGYENPEPSSPKVTCIGQVRVKTKKQGKKMKMRACRSSKRLSSGGEASFRRFEHAHEGLMHQNNSQGIQNQQPDRNQRWVHLPLTICEALRTFGAEFSCLLPCKSSCFSSCGGGGDGGGERGKEKEKEREGESSGGSCGTVFRWLVAVHDGEGERRERDIELVAEEEEERERRERLAVMDLAMECSSRRRSIFDDMEFRDEIFDVNNEGKDDGADTAAAARVSMCIPPKNALLLMRCRSDPAKMSALSHKIWEPPVAPDYESDEEKDDEEEETVAVVDANVEVSEKLGEMGEELEGISGDCVAIDENVAEHDFDLVYDDLPISAEEKNEKQNKEEEEETEEEQSIENRETTMENALFSEKEEEDERKKSMEDENHSNRCSIDALTIRKMFEEVDFTNNTTKNETEEFSSSSSSPSVEESMAESKEVQQEEEEEEEENVKECVKSIEEEEEEDLTHERSDPVPEETLKEQNWEPLEREITKKVLPDCLLLMMCEPKLSMELSKETWVCSTDFIRWLPERHHSNKPAKIDGSNELKKKKRKPPLTTAQPVQPARSSISFPAGVVDQKLVKTGVGYEPLVLTRCKSAPMRSTAKIAAPELACSMWGKERGREMEPHRPATYGVGAAAGVGF